MQAIQTRYIGPTNYLGSRVKAYSEAFPRGVIVPFDYALNTEARHDAAARAFIVAKCWHGSWVRGGSPDGRGFVYVCLSRDLTREGRTFRTPHPQACDPRDLLIVRDETEGGES